tara:strand:+ start:15278 stop:16120 length:843 start_codon:yes stop_codon:yes gene_type:complete
LNIKTFRFSVFKKASLCRHFENEVFKKIKEKKITFPVYLSAGQEYVPASISNIVLNKGYKPLLFGQHRAHSIYLSFGGNVNDLIDELLGKKTGCTFGMGGSLSIHSRKINMFGHDGFMGSNASIGVGACFSSKKPTIIFIGDAALEEDYVLASLSWIAKKKLPILIVVEDNNYAVLTKKKDRRDWSAKDIAKGFKIKAFDVKDDPRQIYKALYRNVFKEPLLININTNRLYWHAGAGEDFKNTFDRLNTEIKILGVKARILDDQIRNKIKNLWKKRSEKQ